MFGMVKEKYLILSQDLETSMDLRTLKVSERQSRAKDNLKPTISRTSKVFHPCFDELTWR